MSEEVGYSLCEEMMIFDFEVLCYRMYIWCKIGLFCLRDNFLRWILFYIFFSFLEFKYEVRFDQILRDCIFFQILDLFFSILVFICLKQGIKDIQIFFFLQYEKYC